MRSLAFAAALSLLAGSALAQPPGAARERFFSTYKQLVETNTEFSDGDCTLAAQRMAERLRAAGFPASDVKVMTPDGRPREGLVTAVLPGKDAAAKAILLLGHIDVVEARRADWTRDPFTMVVENGYVFGRGAVDMKLMDAIWVDTLVRLKESGQTPRRTLKLALTCGEEGGSADGVSSINGATWLVQNHPELVSAEFGLNEGAGNVLRPDGTPQFAFIQVGQKYSTGFTLEVTNPGGHSSRPVPDNAIYRLSAALLKVSAYRFPLRFNQTTRAMFAVRAQESDAPALALRRLLKNPNDKQSDLAASADPSIANRLRTTCVATRLDAGHAANALPQRATATINCRLFPGDTLDSVRAQLVQAIGDPQVKVASSATALREPNDPPLSPTVLGPAKQLAAKHFPTAVFVPTMSAPGTDALAFGAIHVPIYGAPGIFSDPDNGMHGLNERLPLKSVYAARDYLYELVTTYASQPEGL